MCSQILKITLADIILERHLLVFEVRDPKKRGKQGKREKQGNQEKQGKREKEKTVIVRYTANTEKQGNQEKQKNILKCDLFIIPKKRTPATR